MKEEFYVHKLDEVERWGCFEVVLNGPRTGNPFTDVKLSARFTQGTRTVNVDGFYDGEGIYRIRFMPDTLGEWTFSTTSNVEQLDGVEGKLMCVVPSANNHGPVRVKGTSYFAYADGTPYVPWGTTCYAWIYQNEDWRERTFQTLKNSPFNKLRMCLFPKNYVFNEREPELFPFMGTKANGFDFRRFNPDFFHLLEQSIVRLGERGIEVDLILFHPYDKGRWGFDRMDKETDHFYLKYVIARLAAYRNIWWSVANEYDFMEEKTMQDWDRYFEVLQKHDPYGHLRSIHNGTKMYDYSSLRLYDHGKPWVTHVSLQHWDLQQTAEWRKQYGKPVIIDECGYEGNIHRRWGNLTAEEMTKRFWEGYMHGGYVSHGETYLHPENMIWWSHGGELFGESPQRIAFLRKIWEESPAEMDVVSLGNNYQTIGVEGEYYLQYYGSHRPAFMELSLPDDKSYRIEVIDTWNMVIEPVPGRFSGSCRVELPGRPYIAIRVKNIDNTAE